ncbi:MAG: NUDIX domain-containing protein [Candidatus Enterosoma sp.]|nr:NUDIX domain-containing protein [bacterium]MDY5865570.1 NUDIX domain-containing protein [Candidatus Enterosoma sp.]
MKTERSYGAVVYKLSDNKILYLIEHMVLGHISLPKGHIEKGETEEECAIREIKEETGLDVILDTSFRETISYSTAKDVMKDVTFFTALINSDKIFPQKEEVNRIEFLPYDEADKILTYQTDRDVLYKADKYLKRKLCC